MIKITFENRLCAFFVHFVSFVVRLDLFRRCQRNKFNHKEHKDHKELTKDALNLQDANYY
jgi:hypothetical protein